MCAASKVQPRLNDLPIPAKLDPYIRVMENQPHDPCISDYLTPTELLSD